MKSVTAPTFAGDDARRFDVIRMGRSGLDYIDVRGDGRTLAVGFFGALPEALGHEHFAVEGGERITGIRVTAARSTSDDPEAQGVLALRLDRAGDPSTYTLRVIGVPAVDPLYAALPFTFDRSSQRNTDCTSDAPAGSGPIGAAPHIDYLAKDYATFRRLLLDRAALLMPEWNEAHVPDLNITLVELLAYVGDQLSYYQDAVATEAYLSTARKRVSVRRHARLVDYRMHEGANARAWISLSATADTGPIDADEIVFSTLETPAGPAEFFEPLARGALHVYAAHGPMRLYAWGNHAFTLPAGATAATLRDAWEDDGAGGEPLRALRRLEAGAYVLFEALRQVDDGFVDAADPLLRHTVRLTSVRREIDSLYDVPVVEIAWAPADRVPFAFAICAPDPAGPAAPPLELCAAWGNLVAVDHGRSADAFESLEPVPSPMAAMPYRPALAQPDLTFAEPYRAGSAASLNVREPRSALAQITELFTLDPDGHERRWSVAPDLLASGPNDARYVVEVDENGVAALRFGDGVCGRRPQPGSSVRVRYRTGNGTSGNVGADTIVHVSRRGKSGPAYDLHARNPIAASGGTEPESVDDVRALASSAARVQTARAIAPEDYARIAQRDPRLQRAAAEFRWTGSRTLVRVALDPFASEDLAGSLRADVAAALDPVRRIGHDVEVTAASYVPLFVAIDIVVKSGYQRGHVLAALEAAFSATTAADGTRGFFHPDLLTFGDSIAQSRIVARALSVTGVENVTVRRLERLYAPTPGSVPGVLAIGALEIAQLDGDAARPERGVLELNVRGGR